MSPRPSSAGVRLFPPEHPYIEKGWGGFYVFKLKHEAERPRACAWDAVRHSVGNSFLPAQQLSWNGRGGSAVT